MPGFLLDNNHVQPLWRDDSTIKSKLSSFRDPPIIRVSTITLGEIEAGHRMTRTTNATRRDEFTAWLNEVLLPHALPVSATTRVYYAEILGSIWKNHPPASNRVRTEKHILDLGVDINDVWTAAVALEHGLTLVTRDEMRCIRDATPSLAFDSWL